MNATSRFRITGLMIALMTGLMLPGFAGTAGGGTGSPVPLSMVKQVAVNQINRMKLEKIKKNRKSIKIEIELDKVRTEPATISEVFTQSKEGKNTYHIINLKPEGWVIVSADYVAYPIIGASDKGHYSATVKNCGFNAWMENVNNEIHYAATHYLSPHQKALDAWQNLEVPADTFLAQESAKVVNSVLSASVSPLLGSIWGQGGNQPGFEPCATWVIPWLIGYDAYCPYEKNWAGYFQVAPTGCVATATGQVMKYWSWPHAGDLRSVHRGLRRTHLRLGDHARRRMADGRRTGAGEHLRSRQAAAGRRQRGGHGLRARWFFRQYKRCSMGIAVPLPLLQLGGLSIEVKLFHHLDRGSEDRA
jgi:hypothetical protein